MRRLICLLLLLCLPLQSFALPGSALLSAALGGPGIAHELDHAAQIEHHHDDDGSVHYDDSDESEQHIDDYSSSTQVAHLAVLLQPVAPNQCATAVDDAPACFIPTPFPDSPLRPPALSPGFAAGGALHS